MYVCIYYIIYIIYTCVENVRCVVTMLLIAEFQIVTYNEYLLPLVGNGHAH